MLAFFFSSFFFVCVCVCVFLLPAPPNLLPVMRIIWLYNVMGRFGMIEKDDNLLN